MFERLWRKSESAIAFPGSLYAKKHRKILEKVREWFQKKEGKKHAIWEVEFGFWLDLFVFGFGLVNKWFSCTINLLFKDNPTIWAMFFEKYIANISGLAVHGLQWTLLQCAMWRLFVFSHISDPERWFVAVVHNLSFQMSRMTIAHWLWFWF